MGIAEIILIIITLLLVIAVANYGKDTSLGYWGALLLALITSPLVAFLVILIFFKRKKTF